MKQEQEQGKYYDSSIGALVPSAQPCRGNAEVITGDNQMIDDGGPDNAQQVPASNRSDDAVVRN